MSSRALIAPGLASVFTLAFAALLPLALPAEARGRHSTTISTDDDEPVRECRQIHVRFDDLEAAHGEETLTIGKGEASRLTLNAPTNGGMYVEGWTRPEIAVTACTFAGADDSKSAGAALAGVKLVREGDRVSVRGPGGDDWVAYLIVRTPRDVSVDLSAKNGPISVRDVAGTVGVNTVNGPLLIKGFQGAMKAEAQNGPISIVNASGDVKLSAQNGPLTVKLAGTRWEGAGLEARTENGPLTLKLPERYDSGVEVESSGGPVRCTAAGFVESGASADRYGDRHGPRKLTLGSSPAVVRLSTENGPVTVKSRPIDG
ncbi:MAG TPA: hypothetical protein VGR00_12800 [Thermoanaerobaculia bacterium]|jgi:hypothetical protein|nr:hypothetical protein [Thermoanaerobaculia bacterium]